jgi:hypothetical protein
MTSPPRRLDRIDIGILSQLQQNNRITNSELAHTVNLSPTPCFTASSVPTSLAPELAGRVISEQGMS